MHHIFLDRQNDTGLAPDTHVTGIKLSLPILSSVLATHSFAVTLLAPPEQQEPVASSFFLSNASVEVVSTQMSEGGTQRAGFFVKKLDARSMTLTGSAGMMGKSSQRGKCVRPNWM